MNDSLEAITDTLIYNPKLANLKPVFMPDPIVFEPVTPGWYVVFGLIVLIILFILFRLFKRYQFNAYRRVSARELLQVKSEIRKSNSPELFQKISTILKATAMTSFSREKVARLSGKGWQEFLVSKMPSGSNDRNTFALMDYQYTSKKEISVSEIEQLIDASVRWIRRHRV